MDLIEIDRVKKNYTSGELSVPALRGISLKIASKKFVSFVGPSGSGKTTLLNLIGCLDKPTEGTVMIAGEEVSRMNRYESALFRGRHLGFIFQNFNLIPVLTVYENVEYPLMMVQNIPQGSRKKRIMELLEKTGMTSQKDKLPSQLSGGQKQRVAVARALVTEPKLVLADEPTANLDHDTAYKVIHLMLSMKNDFGTTFIFSTHDTKIVGEAEIVYKLDDGLIEDEPLMKRNGKGDLE